MEEQIVQAAKHYGEMARTLKEAAEEASFGDDTPEYLRNMLMKLFDAIKLGDNMEKCRELLTEDTDEVTVEAVMEAAQIVEETGDSVFTLVEKYSSGHEEFTDKIESMVLGSGGEDMYGLLCELYKCEGIIRLAYRVSTRYPVYGPSDAFMGIGASPTSADMDDYVTDDIDILALLEARDKLIASIEKLSGGEA